ncbi:GDSL esterase/lipase-like protein [Drosera capensis]
MTRRKIYLFGDSITEDSFSTSSGGWGASLAHHFSRTADVVLRGYSGYNTRWALKVFDRVFPMKEEKEEEEQEEAIRVVVFFGANDACVPDGYAAFQHVRLDEYRNNLIEICCRIKKRWPAAVILLVTPPPIDEAARLEHPYADNPSGLPERTNEAAGAYAKACVDIASTCGIQVADIWTGMQQQDPDWRKLYLSDGLHLTTSGNEFVFEAVLDKLRTQGLRAEGLPVDLPLFSDIDPKDPLKTSGVRDGFGHASAMGMGVLAGLQSDSGEEVFKELTNGRSVTTSD